jgi:hypothetical protein
LDPNGTYEDYLASFAPAGYMVFLRIRNEDIRVARIRRDPNGHITQITPYRLDADELSVSPAASGPSKNLIVFETFGHGAPAGIAQAVATVPATCAPGRRCAKRVALLTSPHSLSVQRCTPGWTNLAARWRLCAFSSWLLDQRWATSGACAGTGRTDALSRPLP